MRPRRLFDGRAGSQPDDEDYEQPDELDGELSRPLLERAKPADRRALFYPTQRYSCVVLPLATERGNLPPGIHQATWEEIVERYATNQQRQHLLDGLHDALQSLRAAGCRWAYLDGSFVTDKELPGDFDACWEVGGVDASLLDAELLDFSNRRAAQKARYGGELFPAQAAAEPAGTVFLDYFQRDRDTGEPKGIIAIDLRDAR